MLEISHFYGFLCVLLVFKQSEEQASTTDSVITKTTNAPETTTDLLVNCKQLYLNRDVIYIFETTIDDGEALSKLSANFLDVLIRQANSDLLNPGGESSYTQFAMVPFPFSTYMCIGTSCNFGQSFDRIPEYAYLFINNAQMYQTYGTPDGVNEGLLFSQTLTNGIKANETIVLFANNDSGVPGALFTSQNLRTVFNTLIITVSVGGPWNLTKIAAPGSKPHVLDFSTDFYQLTTEIIADMAKLGTICIS